MNFLPHFRWLCLYSEMCQMAEVKDRKPAVPAKPRLLHQSADGSGNTGEVFVSVKGKIKLGKTLSDEASHLTKSANERDLKTRSVFLNNDTVSFIPVAAAISTPVLQIVGSKKPPPKPPRVVSNAVQVPPPRPLPFQHIKSGESAALQSQEILSRREVARTVNSPETLKKPLSERPLPDIPHIAVTSGNEKSMISYRNHPLDDMQRLNVSSNKTKRHGVIFQHLDTAQTQESDSLSLTHAVYKPGAPSRLVMEKTNLNKLKSFSTPNLLNAHLSSNLGTGKLGFKNLSDDIIFEDEHDTESDLPAVPLETTEGVDKSGKALHSSVAGEQGRSSYALLKFAGKLRKGVKKSSSLRIKSHEPPLVKNIYKEGLDNQGKAASEFEEARFHLRKRAQTEPLEAFSLKLSDLHHDQDATLFDHVLVVQLKRDANGQLSPYISYRFPPKMDDTRSDADARMESIPQFCFPDLSESGGMLNGFQTSETFSFVLTDMLGERYFGYCRLIQIKDGLPEVYCIVSPLGLFALYSQVLDEMENQRAFSSSAVFAFLKAVLSHPLPMPGKSVLVQFYSGGSSSMKILNLKRPGDSAIHEHVDLNLLFTTLPILTILQLLMCLLLESKLILSSKSLSLLSSCCHGLTSLLYPFMWQHTYIPVLPLKLIDIVCLPTPYLLGIMPSGLPLVSDQPIEDVVIVNLDSGKFEKQDSERESLPKQVIDDISSAINEIFKVSRSSVFFGETENKARNKVITEVFVIAYIQLIGHFEDFYTKDGDGHDVIDAKSFCKASKSRDQKEFLRRFVPTQGFQHFVTERKHKGPSQGLFEELFAEWKKTRKSDGSYLKAKMKDLIPNFKKKLKLKV